MKMIRGWKGRALLIGAFLPFPIRARAEIPAPETLVYKRVGNLDIKLDVYRPRDEAKHARPVLVWIHGGSLIDGDRAAIRKTPLPDMIPAIGWVLLSIDYRLAPETKLEAIVEDIRDAVAWVRQRGPELLKADPDRVGIAGRSAGGYLALISGYCISPRPRCLFSESGYCDILGEWQLKPSSNPEHYEKVASEDEARRTVSGMPVSNGHDRADRDGNAFNGYVRRHAIWPEAVTGWSLTRERNKYQSVLPVRNVTREYPPTFLLHGRNDRDVPSEQDELMALELERHGVQHRVIIIDGAGHGLRNASRTVIDQAYRGAVDFMQRQFEATP